MEALKSVCFSASRGIAALFLSSSVSERHQCASHPLEVLVVAPLSACVQLSSLAYTQIGRARVSVCDTKSDTKSDTTHETISNKRISVAYRKEANGVVLRLRRNTSLCYTPLWIVLECVH